MTKTKAEPTDAITDDMAAVVADKDGKPWFTQCHLLRLNFCIGCLVLFSSANGYDGSMMNGLQALPQWQDFAGHPTGAWLGFINAAQSLGSIVTYVVSPVLAQRYGRKLGMWLGFIMLILGVTLQTAAQNIATFILGRFFMGVVTSFWGISAPLLITETAHPRHRAPLTALYQCGWYVGSLVAAWATFGTRNYASSWAWRIPSVLQAAIPAVAFLGLLFAPESPRYLVSRDRHEEARNLLVKHHAGGDAHSPIIEFEMAEIQATIQMEKEAHRTTSYLDMVKTPGNRHRLFISVTLGFFAQWNGVGVVSYYLALVLQTVGITSVTDQTLISGCLQIWNLIIAVAAAFSVEKLGRRMLFMTSCIGMLVSYVIITGLSGSFANTGKGATGIAVIPFLFLYYGSYDIAFTPLVISYTCEIWPYRLRARGLTVCSISTMLALFFNIFVNPIALGNIGWKYYIVFVALLIVITLTAWFAYPETKGYTLEEMAVIFDGEQAEVPEVTDTARKVAEATGVDKTGLTTTHVEKLQQA
ncbi:hypothetical protein AYO20_09438 [Fonsecaea nubica]|uniref:Major facilitator superfamily (MFS) profile domain-containing protein n=1 Tax=Fonsecaea nubica TaxID=856822 RepID=A0A178CEV1_9EURO|nr:hypothetical protein AYO20_09438 [Fonsecaea nubica]OAL28490.1 hypothetical protein AYO20_09438 [Fonsecaea nubica]